eukprot:226154_1
MDTDRSTVKASLQTLRRQQTTDGIKNDHIALQLLQTIGGIDHVLDHYLSVDCTSNNLTTSQLNILHELLSPKTDHVQHQATMISHTTADDTTDAFCYTFYTSDTFLHSILKAETARRLINATYSRSSYLFVLVFVIWSILILIYGIGKSIVIPIYGSKSCIPCGLVCWRVYISPICRLSTQY